MASMIIDKMTWMFKISFENATRIKSFKIQLNNNYEIIYVFKMILQLFYNDSKMTINNLI
jgi:hypothetical protein